MATPGADRIGRGEEWLQTNTLDGTKPHEAFIKPDEPAYFQEFGPGNFHVLIGFADPKIINDRRSNAAATESAIHRGRRRWSRLQRDADRARSERAYEPYARSAHLQQR